MSILFKFDMLFYNYVHSVCDAMHTHMSVAFNAHSSPFIMFIIKMIVQSILLIVEASVYVCVSVCVSVCLFANSSKTVDRIALIFGENIRLMPG